MSGGFFFGLRGFYKVYVIDVLQSQRHLNISGLAKSMRSIHVDSEWWWHIA